MFKFVHGCVFKRVDNFKYLKLGIGFWNCVSLENFKSNISLQYQMTIQGHIVTLHAFQIELELVLFAAR